LPPTTYRDALMVFPAHGSTSRDRLLTKYLNATPLDCTCPVLLNAKNMMKRDLKAGYFVFFVGKEGHPETLSVLDSDERIKLIKASEASSFDFTPYLAKTKIAIYPQSTLGQDTFQAVLTRAQAVFKTEIKAGQICHECLSRWQALDGLGLGLDFSFVVVGDPSSSNAVEFKDLIVKKYPKASVVLALDEKGLEAEISQISFRGDVFLVSATSASDQDVQKIYKKLKSAEKIYKLKHPFLGR
jgi:4-hydroxy-3-methylbut-2-enyl diphosphate reductase